MEILWRLLLEKTGNYVIFSFRFKKDARARQTRGGGAGRVEPGGPGKAPKDPPAMGHGGPIHAGAAESGGQWEPRGDPRFRPGPGTGMGHGTPRGWGLGQGPQV